MSPLEVVAISCVIAATVTAAVIVARRYRWYVALPLVVAVPILGSLVCAFAVDIVARTRSHSDQGGWWIVTALDWCEWTIPLGLVAYLTTIVIARRVAPSNNALERTRNG